MEEHKKKTFVADIGQKASVNREEAYSEEIVRANRVLNNMGMALKPVDTEYLEYMGSCAVHIYKSKSLDQLFFASQTVPLRNCPEVIASKAITDLQNRAMEYYGKRGKKLRSGF